MYSHNFKEERSTKNKEDKTKNQAGSRIKKDWAVREVKLSKVVKLMRQAVRRGAGRDW